MLLVSDGSFEPGQIFEVTAHVSDPVQAQTLTLNLPPGMEVQDTPGRTVPAPTAPGKEAVARWKVR